MANDGNYKIILDAQINPVTQADINKATSKSAPKLKVGIVIDSAQARTEINKISDMYKKATSYGATSSTGIKKSGFLTASEYKQTSQGLTEIANAQVKLNNAQAYYSKVGATPATNIKGSGLMSAKEAQAASDAIGGVNTKSLELNGTLVKQEGSWSKIGSVLAKDVQKFGEWMIAGTLLMQTMRQIQAAVAYIGDLDRAMTNIKIITGKSDDEVNSLISSYSSLAKEIGATTLEVANGAEEWLRAGKTADEAMELTRQSITLSKLAVMSAENATKDLISVLNGYKMAASQASSVVDKLIAVDNAAATSANDLATGLQYVASVASQAGVPLDKMIALIGTVSDVTQQSSESIGAAWKTLFTRISNVKVGKFIDSETGDSINFCAVAA